MSSVREKVVLGLAGTGKAVNWQKLPLEGTPPTQYFIFNTMSTESGFSDDVPSDRERYVYLEYYSDASFEETFVETIRTGMKAQGFSAIEERDTSNEYGYQLSMTWYLLEAV